MKTGILRMSSYLLNECNLEEVSDILSKIKFVPFRVEHLYHVREFELIGHSPFFDKIEDYERAPEYNLVISRSEEYGIEVAVERKK